MGAKDTFPHTVLGVNLRVLHHDVRSAVFQARVQTCALHLVATGVTVLENVKRGRTCRFGESPDGEKGSRGQMIFPRGAYGDDTYSWPPERVVHHTLRYHLWECAGFI